MDKSQTLDAMLGALALQEPCDVPPDFMDGVWLRAGQLGEVVARRRRTALFAGLFVIGLGAGVGIGEWPSGSGIGRPGMGEDLIVGERLSPAALLHVGR